MTTTGLRVLAVDDERPALDELAYLLREQPRVDVVLTASDAAEALRVLEDDAVDAVFIDIRMPRLTGLDLAKILARFAQPPQLVFVTAYDEHAVVAFDLKALDYVMKPVRAERLAEAVRRVDDAVDGAGATAMRRSTRRSPSSSAARSASSSAPTCATSRRPATTRDCTRRPEPPGPDPARVARGAVGAGRLRPGAPLLPGQPRPHRRAAARRRPLHRPHLRHGQAAAAREPAPRPRAQGPAGTGARSVSSP